MDRKPKLWKRGGEIHIVRAAMLTTSDRGTTSTRELLGNDDSIDNIALIIMIATAVDCLLWRGEVLRLFVFVHRGDDFSFSFSERGTLLLRRRRRRRLGEQRL